MDTIANFDLLEIFGILWRRKLLILLGGLVGIVLAILVSTTVQKRYLAEGNVVVRSSALTSQDSDAAFSASAVNEAVVTTEQEVLMAPGLLRRVAEHVQIPPPLLERASPGQRAVAALRDLAAMAGPAVRQWVETQTAALFPEAPATPQSAAERRLQFVAGALTVSAGKASSVIVVRAVAADPKLTADIVNQTMQIYMDDRIAEQSRTADLMQASLNERLRQTRQQIADGEDRLVALLKQPGMVDSNDVPGVMRDVSLLGAQLTQAQAELARRQSDYSSATQLRGGRLSDAQGSGSISELRRMLAEQQQNYARLSATLGPNHPSAAAAQRQIASLQGEIGAEASRGVEQKRADLAAAQATVAALQQQLDRLRTQRQAQSPRVIDLDREKEKVASLWKISETLETRLIDLASRPANPNARILSLATVPAIAAYPNKSLYALAGFVLAAIAAMILVLVRSHIYRLRPVPFQLALQLNAPLLGGLPRVSGQRTQRRLVSSALHDERQDAIGDTLSSVALEVENVVRRGDLRCLMITSARSGEGKTTVAIALGRSLAGMGIRVLLVDLDLRRPNVERAFASSVTRSLGRETADEGVGAAPVESQPGSPPGGHGGKLRVRVDPETGMHLLTPEVSGADPIRSLRSEALHRLIDQARRDYELVLFDTPPVMSVPDGLLIASMMDSLLLVTELGRSREPEMEEFSRRLARTGKPICGVIVTKVKTEDTYWEAY